MLFRNSAQANVCDGASVMRIVMGRVSIALPRRLDRRRCCLRRQG